MNPTGILVLVGAIGFFLFYLSKQGCKGDGNLTGPNTPLCFQGWEAFGIGGGGGDVGDPGEVDSSDDPEIPTILQKNIRDMRDNPKPYPLKSRFGPGANPNAVNLAQAYAAGIQDQITVA